MPRRRWKAERTSSAATADSEYQKTRRALIEKLQSLESEANAADEKRRRAVVDAALDGERKAKAEFAAASRKLATMFDGARDVAKNEYNQAKNDAAAQLRFRPEESRQGARREDQADRRQCPDGQRLSRAPGRSRRRLPQVQTESRGPCADSRVVRPIQRSQRRAVHAAGPHGAAAQAAREPDHSQGDEGRPAKPGFSSS